jgi:hypothetical protein
LIPQPGQHADIWKRKADEWSAVMDAEFLSYMNGTHGDVCWNALPREVSRYYREHGILKGWEREAFQIPLTSSRLGVLEECPEKPAEKRCLLLAGNSGGFHEVQ